MLIQFKRGRRHGSKNKERKVSKSEIGNKIKLGLAISSETRNIIGTGLKLARLFH